jgi:hypothetical protein
VTGGHRVALEKEGKSGPETDWLLTVSLNDREVGVSLEVFTRLFQYSTFRPRTRELLLSLRSRSTQISKEIGLEAKLAAWCTPGNVALAMSVLDIEQQSFEALGSRGGERSQARSGHLAAGEVMSTWSYKQPKSDKIITTETSRSALGRFGDWVVRASAGGRRHVFRSGIKIADGRV